VLCARREGSTAVGGAHSLGCAAARERAHAINRLQLLLATHAQPGRRSSGTKVRLLQDCISSSGSSP
jgi:hypothetical protein